MVLVERHAHILLEAQLLAQVVLAQQIFVDARLAPESHVHLLGAQRLVLQGGAQFVDGPGHARELGLEFLEQAGDRPPHGRTDDAHAQTADFAAVDLADGVDGHAHAAQQVGGFAHERLAGHGQLERARGAGEQLHTEFALELHDLLAERRLRYVQPLGRPAETLFFCDGEEVLQLFQVDGHGR